MAGTASAHEYRTGSLNLGPSGVTSTSTVSGVTTDGTPYYRSRAVSVSPQGISAGSTAADGGNDLPVVGVIG